MRPITPLGFSLATLLVATSYAAQADIVLYDRDDTTFSADGYINAFYVNTEVDAADLGFDMRQFYGTIGGDIEQTDTLALGVAMSW